MMGRKKHITHLKEFKRRLLKDIPVDKMITIVRDAVKEGVEI